MKAFLLVVGLYFLVRILFGAATRYRYFLRRRRERNTRDVSRLAADDALDPEARTDLVREAIQQGGPLKEKHRRRILRDPRLQAKVHPGILRPGKKKPKVMALDEATRLFAGTLRTRDRNARDLLADEAQLARLGLPVWMSEDDVARALSVPVKKLRYFSIHREKERVVHYVRFAIPKRRGGGERLILAPKKELKALQRKLLEQLVSKLPVSEHAHGFRPDRSIATNAAPHVGKRVVAKLDLKDFFPSIHVGRVRGLLIAYGYSYPVAASLAVLMTEAERQPVSVGDELFHVPVGSRHAVQGAPTSPGISNAIALTLDHRLAGLARKHGFDYTRYADDLSFSGDDPAKARMLLRSVAGIVRAEGFELNLAKTRVMTARGAQRIAGVTVNRQAGVSRRQRRQLRAALHQANRADAPAWRRLVGRIAFVQMFSRDQAAKLRAIAPASG